MDRRSIIGIILCVLAMLLWFTVGEPMLNKQARQREEQQQEKQRQKQQQPAQPAVSSTAGATRSGTAIGSAASAPAGTTAPAAATIPGTVEEVIPELRDNINVETKLFQTVLTNRGAAIKSVAARDYRLTAESLQPLPIIMELEKGKTSLAIRAVGGVGSLDTKIWEYVQDAPVPAGYTDARQFRTRMGDIEITKTFLFLEPKEDGEHPPDARHIDLRVSVRNLGTAEQTFQYQIGSAAGIVPEPTVSPLPKDWERLPSSDVNAVIGYPSGDGVSIETFRAGKNNEYSSTNILFGGVRNRYFVAVLRPMTEKPEVMRTIFEPVNTSNETTVLEMREQTIAPNTEVTRSYQFFIAPKTPKVLDHYKTEHLDALMTYGWPGPITRLMSWLLGKLWIITRNYGWAIVLLTILVRIALHPLTLKGQKSMMKMQKVAPIMQEIKEKYKHDKKLQQQELMKAMKEHGSPLGGCLPLLLQTPVFFGLWRALYENVGLRQAPFMLWMNDLSKPDNLFPFGSPLPIIGQSFNLLPILCAILMYVQQKMTPKSPDPQQQQMQKMMMYMMPLIFGFMLYQMSSGLMLYFFCSSLFGVIEQKYIRWHLDKIAAAAAPTTVPGSAPVDKKRVVPGKKKK